MNTSQTVALNFFALEHANFSFDVYRHGVAISTEHPHNELKTYKLPKDPTSTDSLYEPFKVSFSPLAEYEEISCTVNTNHDLTLSFLHNALIQLVKSTLPTTEYRVDDDYQRGVSWVLKHHTLGDERISLQPYFLRTTREFGFLADFEFARKIGIPFNREIQRLSLSLDSRYRENRDYYIDRYHKIQDFMQRFGPIEFKLSDGTVIRVSQQLRDLTSSQLAVKSYVFQNGLEAKSQFNGVKAHGPLQPVSRDVRICFLYLPPHKAFAQDLFRALRGDTFSTFPGMEKVFKFALSNQHVFGIELQGFDDSQIDAAILAINEQSRELLVVPIMILPWDRDSSTEEEDAAYYRLKYRFLRASLPTQFVGLPTLTDANQLKWAVSNIGLGVFCKMGGIPWKVQPRDDRCLMIGVGQSHSLATGAVRRFFGYCVLTESSGLYKDLQLLGSSQDETQYLNDFSKNLSRIMHSYKNEFDKIVIHTTFTLRRKELAAIDAVLNDFQREVRPKSLVALKFNDHSRFFGYAPEANSLVPYESTYIELSATDYLVWFEGLQYNRPTVDRRIARPMHISLIYPHGQISTDDRQGYLQDAINLSGANWRGFNAKSSPVSIYYAHQIARFFRKFNELGLSELNLTQMTPWFL